MRAAPPACTAGHGRGRSSTRSHPARRYRQRAAASATLTHGSTQAPCQSAAPDRLELRHGLAQLLDHQAREAVQSAAGAHQELERDRIVVELVERQVADRTGGDLL